MVSVSEDVRLAYIANQLNKILVDVGQQRNLVFFGQATSMFPCREPLPLPCFLYTQAKALVQVRGLRVLYDSIGSES
jgi:hypothetical protein